jgi:hypothetical protein
LVLRRKCSADRAQGEDQEAEDLAFLRVMPTHSRPTNGVPSLAYVADIHVLLLVIASGGETIQTCHRPRRRAIQ